LNLVDDQQAGGRHRLMKLSTAALLGARFPYISPAGGIGQHFFVDGGYFDNSGAGITLELMEYLNRKLSDSSHFLYAFRHRVRFKVLYMSNEKKSSPYQPPKEQNNVKLNPLFNDLAAPVITILGTYSKQTGLNNLKLEKYMQQSEYRWGNKGFMQINLPLKVGDSLDYPTNWVISDLHLDRIRQNIALIRADSVLYK
jgi:hypothetical protein